MPLPRARRLLDALVEVGAVATTDQGVLVAAWQPSAAEGLRLAGFLANVATVFDKERPDDDEGAGGAEAPVAPHLEGAGVEARPGRAREPLLAALITVAAALLASVAPSSGSLTALRTVTSSPVAPVLSDRVAGPSGESAAPLLAAPSPAVAPPGGAVLGDLPSEVAPPQDSPAVVPTGTVLEAGGAPGSPAGPHLERPPSDDRLGALPPPMPSQAEPPRTPPAVAPSPGIGPALPAGRPPAPSLDEPVPADHIAPQPVVCPVIKAPFAVVESASVRPGPFDALGGLGGPALTEVVGTLVNPSDVAVVVGLLEVEVDLGEGRVAVAASPTPRAVPAQGTEAWRVTVTAPPGAADGQRGSADARVLRWSWLDEETSKACPT